MVLTNSRVYICLYFWVLIIPWYIDLDMFFMVLYLCIILFIYALVLYLSSYNMSILIVTHIYLHVIFVHVHSLSSGNVTRLSTLNIAPPSYPTLARVGNWA